MERVPPVTQLLRNAATFPSPFRPPWTLGTPFRYETPPFRPFRVTMNGHKESNEFVCLICYATCSYLQEKLKAKHLLIAKLQEKNDLLQTQIVDAERQLASKKDLADILHAVDFDQLTIQNQQLMSKIRDKTHEFHRIKASSNKASQALETVRKHLQNLQAEGTLVKQRLGEDVSKLDHAKEEIKRSNKIKKKSKELLDIGTQESDGPSPPHALEYMQLKESAQRLLKEVERWKKKVGKILDKPQFH
ncbi:hypothetical protein L7F22_067554 [Adiantum nelumboides]|nr:hypothetical protein [Adiantum nelumboides]